MFTGKPQKNRGAATTYFDEHLSHNDYYTQAETQAGHWIGIGAEQLGLQPGSVVTREEFLRLCDNQHPETGKQLTQVTAKDRRVFFDFQCAPPKSVSILAVTMGDKRIIEAHREASTFALRELEQFAATRSRKGGIEDKDRLTGNLVGAAFTHTSSRALDPQLHTHFVLFNSTWDQTEQRWKALQTSGMFEAIHYGTGVYRNELAKRLQGMGYQLRRTGGSTGSVFEIEGVSPEFIERFSKRSKERDAAVARQEKRLGRKLTRNEVAHVVHQTRPKKLKGASDEQVRKQQLGELGFFEKRTLRKVVEAANGQAKDFAQRVTTGDAIEHGLQHVFERHSVTPQHRILEAALVKGCGQLALDPLKEKLREHPALVRVGDEYSTRDILSKELFLIRTVNAGVEAVAPVARRYEPPSHLGYDQRKALAHVLASPDRVTGFRGLAGSGKTTTLTELASAAQVAGMQCLFCAPTASAADTLRKDNLEAITLQKLLGNLSTRGMLSSRSVIVLDEAGAVGLDDMVKLFEVARLKNCRVILSGDTGQHASVARGDALRILEQYSSYRFSELTTIRRQKPKAFREAVELAAAKQTDKAFAKLLELGAVTEALTDDGQLYQRAADAYLAATKKGKSALLVSPTWAEIDAVTEKVRDTLKVQGMVGQREEAVTVFDSLSWTEAQKKSPGQFEPGQRLRFVRTTKTFAQGETVEVASIQGNTLMVRRQDDSMASLKVGRGSASFDVGEARELKVAAGDWLLLQANAVAVRQHFVNGERVQVREIQNGRIALTDGRTLPAGFNTFTHGYAVTSHSSQGKTVDEVLLVASSRSFGAVNREQFYVSISRGRERCLIFTDDADLLARRVTDSHERKAAVELQALRDDLARLGFVRKEQLKEKTAGLAAASLDFRNVRPMRAGRATRLAPVQQFTRWAEELRRWLSEKLGFQPLEAAAEKIAPTVKETPTETKSRKLQERVRQSIQQRQQSQNRRARGISI
jgi:conjugative relaxase-like TrwC/TraI family protein